MRTELFDLFKPALGLRPELASIVETKEDHLWEGILRGAAGRWYPLQRGVPSFLPVALRPDLASIAHANGLPAPPGMAAGDHDEQARTNVTFSGKWNRVRSYGLSAAHQEFLLGWYCKKLGLPDVDALKQFYRDRRRILEVGPGSGFNSHFMACHTDGVVVAADVSEAAFVAFENLRELTNCHVIQADLMSLPFADETFDFIIADGVLHHTPDTKRAFAALYRLLAPGGQFFFYVYRKMGAARYFCDQYLREHLSVLSMEACYEACEALTELGRELSRLNTRVTLTKPIPLLGIPAGTHDVQRLLYYNFVKCFWNEAFDFETNNMVNVDWYHPHNAWQHTSDEVADWLREVGVNEYRFNAANPNGVSVLLRKPVAQTVMQPKAA
jgi:SAM-dependent methyltransferase